MIRIDKWLWYARVVKTRTLAQKLVKSGKVRVNKVKVLTPGTNIKPEDVLTIAIKNRVLVYRVIEEGSRRGPFCEASQLYEDLSPPAEKKMEDNNPGYRIPRPDKRQRRQLRELKQTFGH